MKYVNSFTLTLIALMLVACASEQKREATPNNGGKVGLLLYRPTNDEIRINRFFGKEKTTKYKDDEIDFDSRLYIPEIETPLSLERAARLNSKLSPISGLHVRNGNICISTSTVSNKLVDYSQENWTGEIKINDQVVPSETTVKRVKVLSAKNPPAESPNKLNIYVCTVEKFEKTTSVEFKLKDATQTPIVNYTWAAPWPSLD